MASAVVRFSFQKSELFQAAERSVAVAPGSSAARLHNLLAVAFNVDVADIGRVRGVVSEPLDTVYDVDDLLAHPEHFVNGPYRLLTTEVGVVKPPPATLEDDKAPATLKAEIRSGHLWRAAIAELLLSAFFGATVVAMFVTLNKITGSSSVTTMIDVLLISLGIGLSTAAISYAGRSLHAGYFNPALTAALLIAREISIVRAIIFLIFQVGGAIGGAFLMVGLSPYANIGTAGANTLQSGVTVGEGFLYEMLFTAIVTFAVMATFVDNLSNNKALGPMAYGLATMLGYLASLPFTIGSMNPARSLATSIASGTWDSNHWVFWFGPLAGGVVVGAIYKLAFMYSRGQRTQRASTRRFYNQLEQRDDIVDPFKDEHELAIIAGHRSKKPSSNEPDSDDEMIEV